MASDPHKDAERYRWFRANISDDFQWYLFGKHGLGAGGIDEAIDAAIKVKNDTTRI